MSEPHGKRPDEMREAWAKQARAALRDFLVLVLVLGAVLLLLFRKGCRRDQAAFSNDAPLGQAVSAQSQEAGAATWQCDNWLGDAQPPVVGASAGVRLLAGGTHHEEWTRADALSAAQALGCLALPLGLIAAQALRKDPL